MKISTLLLTAFYALIMFVFVAPIASAQSISASATWGNSVTVGSSYDNTLTSYIMRHRIGPYSTAQLNYTDNSTHNAWSTTKCMVAGGCQTGGTVIAINGYTSTTITGNGNHVTSDVLTVGTHQIVTSTLVGVQSNIGTMTIGGDK